MTLRVALLCPIVLLALAVACVKDGSQEVATEKQADKAEKANTSPLRPLPNLSDPDSGICGCKLCAPVVSNDACEKDEDCVPDSPCHAHGCMARSKAKAPPAMAQCTQNLDCSSSDVNRCGCVNKRCALGAP